MKLKYYLRGLGIGILVTTVILMITFSGHKADISDKEIIVRAQALGMVMEDQKKTDSIPKGTESLSTEGTERIPKTTQPKNQPHTEKSSQASTQAKTEAASQTTSPTQAAAATPPAATPAVPATDTLPITIAPGESSNAVADKLFAASLVDDAATFNKYLVEHKYDSLIQPGTFTIPKGTTYEEISKLLMGKK